MSTYAWIDFAIILFPFLFSFEKRIGYYKKWPAVLAAILVVGVPYVAWDMFVTGRGDWAFSKEHVLGVYVGNLPIEEVLFFVVVPYSCLFVYEALQYFLKERRVWFSRSFYLGLALLLGIGSFSLSSFPYTSLMLAVACVTVGVASFTDVFSSSHYWYYTLVTLGLFVVFNHFLTSLPIVTYGTGAILGVRVGTIPVEDFVYNLSMLTAHLMVYREALARLGKRVPRGSRTGVGRS